MISLTTPSPEKTEARDKLNKDVAAFLERGGKIYKARHGESGIKDRAHTFTINNEKCDT